MIRHLHRRTPPDLQQITIIRTHVPLLRLFKLGQPQICTRFIPVPILRHHTDGVRAARRGAQARKADADAVARPVVVRRACVFGEESVGGDDAACVAEADLPGRPDGSTVVAAEVEVEPADRDRERGVDARRDEEQRRVFEMRPRVHGQQDGEAGDGDGGRDEREEEAVLQLVREEGDDDGEEECTDPGRDAVELGADLRIAVCLDDAWGEECVAVGGDDQSEVHQAAEEEFVVFEAVEDILGGDAALAGGAALVLFKPGSDVGSFIFSEPAQRGINHRVYLEVEGMGKRLLTISPLPESLVS